MNSIESNLGSMDQDEPEQEQAVRICVVDPQILLHHG